MIGSMNAGTFVLLLALVGQAARPSATDALGQAYFLFMQGRALEDSGDFAGAIAAFRKAAELSPRAADVRAELAALFAREGRADEAIKEAQAALAIDPQTPDAHRTLGFVQAELADSTSDAARAAALRKEAIDHLDAVVKGQLNDPGAQLMLGRLYVRAGEFTKGIDTLRAFLVEEPGYAEAVLLLAQAYDSEHRTGDAIRVLEELVAGEPDQLRGWALLAELRERNRQWKAAA